jgi:hypothetical protein
MSVIKLAFGLGLVVLMMPTDEKTQARVFDTAAHAVHRAATFCERNPLTCDRGAEVWATFKQKAAFGGRMAWTLLVERGKPDEPAEAVAGNEAPAAAPVVSITRRISTEPRVLERGTLAPRDLEPKWRGARHPI